MLPLEPHLELRSRSPAGTATRPPLLFVHGGYCDAWCWEPHFLPWFARRGHASFALSLRGHGESAGRDLMWLAGLDDYAADVERVAAQLPSPPVLVGHSMGAAIVERLMATRPVRAAALLAPIPPMGLVPVASRLAAERPDALLHLAMLDPMRLSKQVLATLEPFYFSDRVDRALLREAVHHLNDESPRALLDMSLRLHWSLPERRSPPLLVLGARGDRICRVEDVEATARHHGVAATVVDGLAHMLMLEPEWKSVAQSIADFVDDLPRRG